MRKSEFSVEYFRMKIQLAKYFLLYEVCQTHGPAKTY